MVLLKNENSHSSPRQENHQNHRVIGPEVYPAVVGAAAVRSVAPFNAVKAIWRASPNILAPTARVNRSDGFTLTKS